MIVLDSHIWFWWINEEHHRLSPKALAEIGIADRLGVSAVSCFELALAYRRRRLSLPVPAGEWFPKALAGSGIELLPLTPAICERAANLPEHHRDPFDRLIIATALEEKAKLASNDALFGGYAELEEILLR